MSSFLKKVFGSAPVPPAEPEKTPDEQAREWRRQLAAEMRRTDTQIRKIKQEEQKVVVEMKKAAKTGDQFAVKTLAKHVLHARKSVKQLLTAKTQMNSISMQLQHQAATMKSVGVMSKSTEIMMGMNELMNISDMRQVMMNMSKEMMKSGLIDEMVEEGLEDALGDVEEEELDEEVNKVIADVMTDKLKGTRVTGSRLPQKQKVDEEVEEAAEEEEENDEELMAKYNALRGKA